MKQCFTCANKIFIPEIPENKYQCGISKKFIKQTDPECEHYKGDPTLEEIRESLRQFAKKERQKLEDDKQ